ncbi:unnamed protein product [Vitrella brassicaformis CCMP3155]|uniref:Uncharacterized protein n=1 Tax=Vitrella brassicaformis (strain CCMP3155) TaxID=1169540 RepID=A0A0G4FIU3_VITBC|nr:unnamed protein product [Vitrella brassicaformis CCMP3155]|eukprot:CEM13676.1 unnamed protein product [Vitrella brassicaformis CCMP3155]
MLPAASFVSILVAFLFFRFSAHRNKTVMRHRKTTYSFQLTLIFSIQVSLGIVMRGSGHDRCGANTSGIRFPADHVATPWIRCFDLLTDIAIPYCVLLGGASTRLFIRLVARFKPNQRETQDQHDAVDIITVRDAMGAVAESNSDQKPGPSLSHLSTRAASYRRSKKSAAFDRLRSMLSGSSLASQLSTILDAQSKFVTEGYHPTFLRRLSDVHLYGLAELTALIFSNLCSIIFEQILSPSGKRLAERLAGLAVLVLIEMSLEFLLFCVSYIALH